MPIVQNVSCKCAKCFRLLFMTALLGHFCTESVKKVVVCVGSFQRHKASKIVYF